MQSNHLECVIEDAHNRNAEAEDVQDVSDNQSSSFSNVMQGLYGIDSDEDTEPAGAPVDAAEAGKVDDDEESACIVCWQAAVDPIFKPCNHAATCSTCALMRGMPDCPTCQLPIKRVLSFSPAS